MNENYGDNFQQKSKYTRENLPRHRLDWMNKPETYKKYENPISKIKLPDPEFKKGIDFWKVILNRQSNRKYDKIPLSKEELSLFLFGMTGLTRAFPQFAFRTTPSAGGLYPIETYSVVNDVNDIPKGIYHYNIPEHSLECVKNGDFKKEVSEGCLGQAMAYNSAVNFIWTAVIYLDCGHIGQNFYLIAEALGLGACTIGAIFDDELNNLLDIDGKTETAIYVGVVGKKFNTK